MIARGAVRTLVALVPALLAMASPLVAGAAKIAPQSRLYTELAPVFAKFHPPLTELELVAERVVDARHSVMIVRASVPAHRLVNDFSTPEALKQETFGVFVIDRRSGA